MGTELRCKKCNQVLFEFDEVPSDVLWYSRLRHRLGGECPNCGHKLPNVSKYACKMQFEVISVFPVFAK
ncbi:hypothetical protein AC477_02180 [miscellaneous Crenarchaeota group-1 archaeon SG8-32-1]|uniref:Uncharacterized protein n=1 Tax=miscellaneous Crenarchaeota group-1 archaeon SG8-32-1 TaxID=1685124 RepID=A0A0M0BXA3_9ARCH|nr:MAG: hypothetical protein AC477_02180 [miscellaneous Crenarchaeota group-1 archaeon SG8-32-1]